MRHLPSRGAAVLVAATCLAAFSVPQAEKPAVQVVTPENGDVLEGGNVVVETRVRGVELTPRRSGNGAYLLLKIDDAPAVKSFTSKFTFQGIAPGDHVLRVELRRSDDSAFDPPVRTQVRFSVRQPLH